ncbi:MAG: hypothetical protein EOM30_01025 [Clostridia bacterium]|nr:hypothetical protein [Clostridia bacterium]NLS85360.1 hypothetical protein [Oscillospiraceae bacterium]
MLELCVDTKGDTIKADIDSVVSAREVNDYNQLANTPTLNGQPLEGDFVLAAADTGAVSVDDIITNEQIALLFGGE